MKMWPETSNPKVESPPIETMSESPSKNRKKELGEVPNSEKLSRRGKTMTCSICKSTIHNRRTCTNKPPSTSEPNKSVDLSHLSQTTSQSQTSQPSQSRSQTQSSQPTTNSGNKKGAKRAFKRPRLVGH
ncbi:hypothetical protein HAX54_022505, partial [Datura stramonium]|nr:hypothetical protein [Datura stramonium]